MSSARVLRPETAPPAAFARLTLNEVKLAWRNPRALAIGLGLPVLMLVIFGELPYFQRHPAGYGGLTGFEVKVPTLAAMVIAGHAVMGLSLSLATCREYGILRRMSTTPVPRAWVLAAPAVIQFCLVAAELVLLFALAVAAFGLAAPKNPGALVLSLFLCVAALFGVGLTIAAVARASTLIVFTAAVYCPLLFFSGLWIPIAQMPGVLQHIATYTRRRRRPGHHGLDARDLSPSHATGGDGRLGCGLHPRVTAVLLMGVGPHTTFTRKGEHHVHRHNPQPGHHQRTGRRGVARRAG